MVAILLAMQVREQEQQGKRQRPDNCGNPRPDYEMASSTLSNSTGKKHRTDPTDYQQCEHNVLVAHDARSVAALR
jgi:hypothetical protein